MNERKINWFLIVFAVVMIPIFYSISENSGLLQGKLINSGIDKIFQNTPHVRYDLNVPLRNHMVTRMKTYEAIGIKHNIKDVELYIQKLGIKNHIEETAEEFLLEDEDQQFIVSKNQGLIQYKNFTNENKEINRKISSEKAIEEVLHFIDELNLSCHHQKAIVEDISNKHIYQIRFVNTLEGISNYSYCTNADVSYEGEILRLECYKFIYKPRGIVSIRSMKDAYKELIRIPVDEKNIQVDIKKAELIYFSREGSDELMVEPAYRFSGETDKGGIFEYFISAL